MAPPPQGDFSPALDAELARQMLEAVPDALVAVDQDGNIELVNVQVERLFGYARAEMLRNKIEMLLPARYAGLQLGRRPGAAIGVTTQAGELKLPLAGRRKDGTEFPIDISLSPLETPEGRFGVARVRDITEQLRLQRELREKAALIDLAHDAIVVLDPTDGRIRYWNRGAEALYGYAALEATGHVIGELLKREASGTFAELIAKVALTDHWEGRLQHTTKDGDELVVESRWALLRDHAGVASGLLEINRDVTEVVRASEALSEANQSLEAHVRERTADLEAFSYSVSHDLRTPLRALNGFVAILAQEATGELNEEARDAMSEITSNAIRMGRLIDDLLAFARLGSLGLQKRHVEMDSLARQTATELATFMAGRQIELDVQAMPPCYGDPALLEQVWTNLLSNAIKFSAGRSPARITAGALIHKGRVVYFVRDNGVGFDIAHASKLFGVFQRLHAADEFEGNGVGLANVLRICGRHGGTAWAEAALDRGATFYFTVGGGRP